jgi:hypothetical protein
MATVLCFCRRYHINPEHATHVRQGIPLCHERTCERVKHYREAMALRRTPYFDEEPDDRMPDEIHAKPDNCVFGWKPCSSR